jgi:hypothetical protein
MGIPSDLVHPYRAASGCSLIQVNEGKSVRCNVKIGVMATRRVSLQSGKNLRMSNRHGKPSNREPRWLLFCCPDIRARQPAAHHLHTTSSSGSAIVQADSCRLVPRPFLAAGLKTGSFPRVVMVLPVRIELTTSPLPRGCSTTELRQLGAWRVGNTLRPGCLARQAEGRRVGSAEPGTPHRLRVFLHRLSPGRDRYWRRRGQGETRRRPTNTCNVTENVRADHSGTVRRLVRNSLRGRR